LDTRTKIVSLDEARALTAGKSARWFAGHFDPLLAEHVQMLSGAAASGRPLIIEITDPIDPLLSRRARAELVAGLSCVDYVVIDLEATQPPATSDDQIRSRFIDSVRKRAAGATA
jgi:bifunctional ADP-heptose synthase (sugar kinase/adenylyltransferase)